MLPKMRVYPRYKNRVHIDAPYVVIMGNEGDGLVHYVNTRTEAYEYVKGFVSAFEYLNEPELPRIAYHDHVRSIKCLAGCPGFGVTNQTYVELSDVQHGKLGGKR